MRSRDDQEVATETLLADDLDLVSRRGRVYSCGQAVGEPALQPGADLVAQPGLLGRRPRVPGTPACGRGAAHTLVVGLHPLGDQQGGVARAGHLVVPQRAHLGGGLEVVAVAVELEPVGVRQRLAGLHAQQRLVVVRGVAGDVVAVVGGQRRDRRASCRSRAGPRGPGARCRARGPSTRGRSCPCRRCPATWRRPPAPRGRGRAAAGSAPHRRGSRWWR